ncbi:Phage terminase large subunit [uncultured Caudovirales phage]|uniref:Phage terminase large subunit n=1 Tax=uncultured Caudovirales phage TaxID=2100421 RepID=A0A6J5LHJ6_9CAUD|nr:Phage terminase large subunit [uncultured Caudovirales phage]
MKIEFSDKQKEAFEAVLSTKYSFILFGGSMGGGKTYWGLTTLLFLCEVFPKSRFCVIRENLEKIRITTIPSFQNLRPSGTLKTSPFEYTHPNGSVIMFKGENYDNDKELNWLKGLEVSGFLFEEINECQEQTLDICFGRVGRWKTPTKIQIEPFIIATCNPSSNWIKSRVYDKWKTDTLPKNWLYIPSKITDNPYLTDSYKENLKNMPRFQYEVFVEGNWDVQMKTGGEFYKCFEIDKHVGDNYYNPDLPLHISFDDNVNPYLPVGIFQIVGKTVYMIDEIAGVTPMNTVTGVCKEFIRKYPAHTTGLFIYGDATSRKEDTKLEKGYNFYRLITDALKQYRPTLRVTASNPSVKMRGDWINTIFEKELGGITIKIGSNCKKTINDFIAVKEAPDGTKNKETATDPNTKKSYQIVGHFSDLFDYLMCSAFANDFTAYQRGGAMRLPTLGKNISKNNY